MKKVRNDARASDVVESLRRSQVGKVKVAVSDIDGILRGKYIHRDKFFSAVEGGFGFCDVVFGWDAMDQCYDNTKLPAGSTASRTRWRGSTSAPIEPCRGTTTCPSSSATS